MSLQSPFEIIPALKFAVLFVLVLLGIRLGEIFFGSYGVIATTFFSAFADVDAAIVSVVQTLKSGVIDAGLVTAVVMVAMVVNTMVKALYVYLLSRHKTLSLHTLMVTTVASIAGVVGYLVV